MTLVIRVRDTTPCRQLVAAELAFSVYTEKSLYLEISLVVLTPSCKLNSFYIDLHDVAFGRCDVNFAAHERFHCDAMHK
jgi:hypothetical protein